MKESSLGKRINAVRKRRGLTSEQMAEKCHINANYLRQIECGAKIPSLPVFVDICNVLSISPNYLLNGMYGTNEVSDIRELEALWRSVSPERRAMAVAMVKTVLEFEYRENYPLNVSYLD